MTLALLLSLALAPPAHAATLRVAPVLQDAQPNSIWVMWETDAAGTPTVAWGPTAALGQSTTGTSLDSAGGGRIHHAQITGLQPSARVFYQVTTGEVTSEVHSFLTPPDADGDRSFRVLAMSDMQRSSRDPNKFTEIIDEGVLPWATAQWGPDVAEQFAMVLIPGDLVDAGDVYEEWADTFFGPLAPVSAQVPIYPVLGNHEVNTHWYFDYFHLPEHGEADPERWWSTTYDNLLVLGMDSNAILSWTSQLTWLTGVLDAACDEPAIDFVFAELHHPYESELWIPGNLPFTGQVIDELEAFTERCGKPSVHFFGHTHAYSRGQAQNTRHLMVNVATAGGAIDYWGEQLQKDYAEFTVSDDDWGFVVLDVTSGSDPSFRLRRLSRGDNRETLDNLLTDELIIRLHDDPMPTPTALAPHGAVDGTCVTFEVGGIQPAGTKTHQATQWQVSTDCDDFSSPVHDSWFQDQNRYLGVDSQKQDDLADHTLRGLPKGDYCWRSRVRDSGLVWSDWTAPVPFHTTPPRRTDNLLPNGSAEDELDGWFLIEGHIEPTTDGRCGAAAPRHGARTWALGGVCDPLLPASMSTEVAVDADTRSLPDVSAFLSADVMGADLTATLTFRGPGGDELGTHTAALPGGEAWARQALEVALPAGTDRIILTLTATEGAQVDDVDLSVGSPGELNCAPVYAPAVVADPDTSAACGCATGRPSGWAWLLGLIALGWRRRA